MNVFCRVAALTMRDLKRALMGVAGATFKRLRVLASARLLPAV